MITIQAGSMAELKKLFEDIFGVSSPSAEKTRAKAQVKAPLETPPPEAPVAPPPEAPVAPPPEAPPEGPKLTYDDVMVKVRAKKMGSDPEIGDKVRTWLRDNLFEKLSMCDSNALARVVKELKL